MPIVGKSPDRAAASIICGKSILRRLVLPVYA